MRRITALLLIGLVALGAAALLPEVRGAARALLRPEAPPPITPVAASAARAAPPPTIAPPPSPAPTSLPRATPISRPRATPTPAQPATATATPTPPGPVEVNGRLYDAYVPAASKEGQAYKYSCEFDAAWVIFATFGYDVSVEEMIQVLGVDERVEPYIEEIEGGFVIHGGDIAQMYSGDYTANYLARSTGTAFRRVFERYGLHAEPVHDQPGVEAALRSGALVWMKTTVDFRPWRPAVWRTPEGAEFQTVLGNDHAVVAIGYNSEGVVIRDVLGPTSSNWQRPYEYEVSWETFLAAWEAQAFDGLAVAPPRGSP